MSAPAPSRSPLEPGSTFAGYEVVRALGWGSFGAVYEATRRGGAQRVALKVLHVELLGHEEIVARFMREARAVASLRHPNIVAAVELGDHEGQPFLAMEFLEGETLGALLKREGPLPLRRALDVLVPVMAAMRTVHARGIVHRDLKPGNVFLTYDDGLVHPKVLDFGVAKMVEPGLQLTRKDDTIGTPSFMSPEQMLSPLSVDPRSDQWALAVMLYNMLTGVKPFAGGALRVTLSNVLYNDPAPLRELAPEVPAAVARAITRALRKPPADRFASVHEFARALLPFASDASALAYAATFYAEAVGDAPDRDAPMRQSGSVARAPRSSKRSSPSNPSLSAQAAAALRSSKPPRTFVDPRASVTPTPQRRRGMVVVAGEERSTASGTVPVARRPSRRAAVIVALMLALATAVVALFRWRA